MYNHSILIAIVLRSIYTLLDLSHIHGQKGHTTSHWPTAMMSIYHMHVEIYTHQHVHACMRNIIYSIKCVCVVLLPPQG